MPQHLRLHRGLAGAATLAVCLASAFILVAGTVRPAGGDPPRDAASPPASADLPPRRDIVIRPVRWQTLPPEVKQACIAPDGRLWCVFSTADQSVDLGLTKRSIEREFGQAAPQIIGARPALFEKGGRVWFIAENGRTLLGYQAASGGAFGENAASPPGKWIEHPCDNDDPFVGNCPGQGRYNPAGDNLALDGRAFFVTDAGVAVWDGGRWTYRRLLPAFFDKNPKADYEPTHSGIQLCSEADSKGVFALTPAPQAPLFRYRWGAESGSGGAASAPQAEPARATATQPAQPTWQPIPLPERLSRQPLQSFAVLDGDQLLLRNDEGRLGLIRLSLTAGRPPAEWDQWVKQLSDNDFKVREEASAKIEALGEQLLPAIRKELEKATDPEVRSRLEAAIQRLGADHSDEGFKFGGITITRVFSLTPASPPGTALLDALVEPEGEGPAPARTLLLLGAQGKVRRLGLPSNPNAAAEAEDEAEDEPNNAQPQCVRPVWMETSRLLWLPPASDGTLPRLLSLAGAEKFIPLPDPTLRYLHAARTAAADRSDLMLVLATVPPLGGRTPPLVVYQPEAKDDRLPLPADAVEIAPNSPWCITPDGFIWVYKPEGRLERYDGRSWQVVRTFEQQPTLKTMVPGRNGEVLIEVAEGPFILFKGTKQLENRNLAKLIEENRDEMVSAFTGPTNDRYWPGGTTIAADKAGNVWLLGDKALSVRVGDQWIDADDALCQAAKSLQTYPGAGSGDGANQAAPARNDLITQKLLYMAWVGDGSSMYVANYEPAANGAGNPGAAYVGQVRDGKLTFLRAPLARMVGRNPPFVYDKAGGLWIGGSLSDTPGFTPAPVPAPGVSPAPQPLSLPRERMSASNPGAPTGEGLAPPPDPRLAGLVARRITTAGAEPAIVGFGLPRLIDRDGTLWLVGPQGGFGARYTLVRDGRSAGVLAAPDSPPNSPLFADKPGSAYLWAPLGLRQYEDIRGQEQGQRQGAPPAAAAPKLLQTFNPTADERPVRTFDPNAYMVDLTPRGLLVTDSKSPDADGHDSLHLIPLPGCQPPPELPEP